MEKNRCDKCKFCHVESGKDVVGNDKGIPLYSNWYVCEITGNSTDPSHCMTCCTFKEKDEEKQQD